MVRYIDRARVRLKVLETKHLFLNSRLEVKNPDSVGN